MKKTLVAIAALSAISAFAQSSVTAYGVFDAGYSDMSREVTKATDGTVGGKQTLKGLAFNQYTTSRIGFKGTEDLGGGKSANFVIETGINSNPMAGFSQTAVPTAGATQYLGAGANGTTLDATTIGGRELNASLKLASGTTIGAGFGSTAIRTMSLGFDAAGGANLVGGLIVNDANFSSNRATGLGVTQVVGAWTVGAALSKNNTQTAGADNIQNAQGYTMSLAYNQGPVAFGGARQQTVTNTAAANSSKLTCSTYNAGAPTLLSIADGALGSCDGANSTVNSRTTAVSGTAASLATDVKKTTDFVGVSYDLTVAKLFASYGKVTTDDRAQTDATGEGTRKAYTVGAQVPMGAFVPFASISKGKQSQVSSGIKLSAGAVVAGTAATERSASGYVLGGMYNLSKRTFAYASVGQTKLDGATTGADYGVKVKQAALGLAHSF